MPCLNFTSNWPSLSWILIRVRNQTAILNFRRKSPDGEAAVTMSATEVLNSVNPARDQYVVLHGILKKLKTGRRRYFVLFRDGPDQSARLDYFESEKKFKARFSQPKRSIVLKSCFHINRRLDTKHKFVLALYTKDDCFCLVMDSESKMVQWLKAMTEMHQAATEGNGGSTYEHVWQVTMEKKGLAEERGIRGNYHLCLNENMLSLVRFGIDRNAITESHVDLMEFPLSTIRRCGDSHNYFYMEVGRFSAIGSGELWMGTEDPLIAQNMHKTIIKSIARLTRSRLGTNSSAGRSEREDMPPMRGRSCSANEASKPIMVLQRRQTHVGTKPCGFSPVGDEDESDLCEGACCIYPDGPSTPSTTCSSGGTVVTAYGRSPASSIGSLPMHDGIHMLDAALSASRTSTPLKVILAGTRSAPMAAFDHIDDEPESEYMDIFRPSSADGSDSDSSIAVPPSLSPAKPTVLVSTFTSAITPSNSIINNTTKIANSAHARSASQKSKPWSFFRRHSVSAGSGSSSAMCATANTACHQRALSLPITSPLLHQSPSTTTSATNSPNSITTSTGAHHHHHTPSLSLSSTTTLLPPSDYVESAPPPPSPLETIPPLSAITTTSYTIQPFHQRTRSLPLTEETAVQITMYHSNVPVVQNGSASGAPSTSQCHCNVQPCRHHTQHRPTTTTISHFYNRHNQTHFELINDHQLIHDEATASHRRSMFTNSHNTEQTVPTMTSSMDSIIEDDDASSSGDFSQENSMMSQLLASMGAAGSAEMKRLMAGNRMTGSARNSVSGPSTVASTGGGVRSNGGVCHQSPRSSALGRERCDSLPTRNRTSSETMSMPPPPPRIGGHMLRTASNFMRPSNSPPLSSSGGPMSPSAGCSESEGSSLSIDETDGFNSHSGTPDDGHQFGSRHFNASEKVIPEENLDECWMADNNKKNLPFTGNTRSPSAASLSLPIQSHSNVLSGPRKGSPAAPVSYMDRYSPCGSSPGDQQMSTGGYMLMSPGADLGRSLYTNSSGASSLAEDVYVLSDPPAAPEEYMDMMESSNRHRQQTLSEMSSAASSCSITSGTPSNDLRFGEFQLDKVVSIFTPEDDASLNERPARAYSVGSRSEHNKRKLIDHIMPNELKSNRLRAFSVGAKVPRSDAYRGMIQTVPLNCVQQKKDANAANNNLKSSSVLTLSSSHKRTGSGSVIDPMDDLMEIDFTSSPSTSSITMEEDVCDSPVHQYSSSPLAKSQPMSVPAKKTIDDHHHVLSTGSRGIDPPNGYVPMRPTLHTSLQSNYIPMKSVRSPPYNSTAFAAPSSSAKSQTPVVASSPSSTSSAGRNNNSVTISDDYLPMSPSQTKNLSAPEGYMEMGWVKNTKSTVPTRPASTVTSNNPNNNEPAYSRQLQDSRPISMPININQGKSNLNNERKNISLNLAQSSSNHSTRVRCDSKDSGIVTPSGSHSTIFPFSPGSPNSQPPSFPSSSMLDENTPARKCLVDGSSGSLQLARDDATPSHSSKPELAKILNTDVVPASQLDGLSSDYADMSLGSSEPKATTTFARKLSSARTTTNADYTLMHPFPAKKPLLVTINNNLSNATAKTNQTGFRPISNLTSPSASASPNTGYELLQVRPNSVNSEKVVAKTLNTSTRPNSVNSDRLTAANVTPTPSTTTSSSSSTSTLCGGGSKSQSPLSVQRVPSNESNDSQSIQTASSRPPSVSSEREIHYASLDLPPATSPASTERLEVDIELATESRANSLTGGTDSSTSPSSASAATDPASAQPSAFTYAQIDFIKSEQLKEAAKLAAAAIASSKSPNTSC